MRDANFAWTPERVDALRRHVDAKLSMSLIAAELFKEFHQPLTRNAVIGKLHRLGINTGRPARVAKPHAGGRPRKPPQPKPQRIMREIRPVNAYPATKVQKAPPIAPALEPPSELGRVTFMELRPSHCKWGCGTPGEPAFRFCGAKRVEGRPYCAYHTQLAYVPLTGQQRRIAGMAEAVS